MPGYDNTGDERGYLNGNRAEINWKRRYVISEVDITPLVRVCTYAYAAQGPHFKKNAHLETFVISADPRVPSSQYVHVPFRYLAAKRTHAALVAKLQRLLGVSSDAGNPQQLPGSSDAP